MNLDDIPGGIHTDMLTASMDGSSSRDNLPVDCRMDEGGSLAVRSAPLDTGIDMLGQPRVRLHLAADRPQGFVAAVLADEVPDGSQSVITRGACNLMFRDGTDAARAIVPGEEMEIALDLHGMAWSVPAGHRLVLHLSSTYWPILWPAPKCGSLATSLAPAGRSGSRRSRR